MPYILITIAIISVACVIAIVIAVIKSDTHKTVENDLDYQKALAETKAILAEVHGIPEVYINYLLREVFTEKVKAAAVALDNYRISKHTAGYVEYKELARVNREIQTVIECMNRRFVDAEMQRCSVRFDNIDGKSLDTQQREAVVTDELHNLVVAGAGSGKTLTISGKVSYLCTEKGYAPSEILLITFTNKAAVEMNERICHKLSLPVEAVTLIRQ